MRRWILAAAVALPALGWSVVENSAVARMEKVSCESLQGKVPEGRLELIDAAMEREESFLRVVSFNMLFNKPHSEELLDPYNHWVARLPRVVEYLEAIEADLIGSQELQLDQIDDLMERIGEEYGVVIGQSSIFYRKERLELVDHVEVTLGDRAGKPVALAIFNDKVSGHEVVMLNTHFSYFDADARWEQALGLSGLAAGLGDERALVVVGDFNTFSAQRDRDDLPYLNGDWEMTILTAGNLEDARVSSLLGHFGPIASTNFCEGPFNGYGTPGIILDHILVNGRAVVVRHAIDSATVDGGWPSDHFPVVADLLAL